MLLYEPPAGILYKFVKVPAHPTIAHSGFLHRLLGFLFVNTIIHVPNLKPSSRHHRLCRLCHSPKGVQLRFRQDISGFRLRLDLPKTLPLLELPLPDLSLMQQGTSIVLNSLRCLGILQDLTVAREDKLPLDTPQH